MLKVRCHMECKLCHPFSFIGLTRGIVKDPKRRTISLPRIVEALGLEPLTEKEMPTLVKAYLNGDTAMKIDMAAWKPKYHNEHSIVPSWMQSVNTPPKL